jgi:hypothetical protein
VKNAGHFDYAVFAAAIEKKMARLLHPCTVVPRVRDIEMVKNDS